MLLRFTSRPVACDAIGFSGLLPVFIDMISPLGVPLGLHFLQRRQIKGLKHGVFLYESVHDAYGSHGIGLGPMGAIERYPVESRRVFELARAFAVFIQGSI